ncbi:cytochrome P450 [Lasiosphaeria hispida]|uniref:Cytochrome P450 n=1 Tax=Lasiosphaeria hispida TaxID=260671 RepID=A0AAJ0MEV8_9PEZI|nr:cytochrome P450 [Lasiosphaeria hispida]
METPSVLQAVLRAVPLPLTAVLVVLAIPVLALVISSVQTGENEPWSLPNWKGIPVLGNTIQYMADNGSFIARASLAMRTRDVVKFSLGPTPVYLVTGAQNVQALFRKSTSISSDKFLLMVMGTVMCFTPKDYAKFANDKTGRLPEPVEGTAASHKGLRYWAEFHHHNARSLSLTSNTASLTAKFYEFFQERVRPYPVGEWKAVNLLHFMRSQMAGAAIKAMTGERLLERSGEEDLLGAFWDYDTVTMRLVYALPKWMDPSAWRIRDRFHQMAVEWLKKDFDPLSERESVPQEIDWHPVLGLAFMRDYLNWGKRIGLSVETRAGYFIGFLLGLNANSIPIAAWALFELVQDPSLWKAVQEEAESAFEAHPVSGERVLNIQTMLGLPLLQSVYAEALRLHVSVNVTREVISDTTTIAGYQLPKHALIQAPTYIASLNEKVWGTAENSASEFWAYRHIRYTTIHGSKDKKPEFAMAAGPSDFFPYGGGISMCPGRHFAKQEIMATLAIIVTTFDVEMVEWVTMDGKTRSDRPARDDLKWSGSAALPPDRDMKVRWRRRF